MHLGNFITYYYLLHILTMKILHLRENRLKLAHYARKEN